MAVAQQPTSAAGPLTSNVVLRPSDAAGDALVGEPYFKTTAHPGDVLHLNAYVGNNGTSKLKINVAAVDAISGGTGGILLKPESQPRTGVSTWISLSAGHVVARPHRGAVVSIDVAVPRNIAPGQYLGAITALVPVTKTRSTGGVTLTVQPRVAIGVHIDVPGSWTNRFSVHTVSVQRRPGGRYAVVSVTNAGTTLLPGDGTLTIWKVGVHRAVITQPIHLLTTVPHTTIPYTIALPRWFGPGRYTAAVTMTWKGGTTRWHSGLRVR
jgi:hypothetical protein